MKRHASRWLKTSEHTIDVDVRTRQLVIEEELGRSVASEYELYAQRQKQLDQFWDSVKAGDAEPDKLLEIMAQARSGLLWLCAKGRTEVGR